MQTGPEDHDLLTRMPKPARPEKTLETRLKEAINAFEDADARGSSGADKYEIEVQELKRQVAKEKKEYKPPQHPA